ncbi:MULTISPECIES: heavy metal translocating P-type ATPase [Leuconostoc]|uniref:heavy metal translocating P-type ATPase n=1 Tax=Leuconostoc TaxID=1243 RepID=UPI0007448F48|nr:MULTISPECIES: heavy metal translocating P-type ATPase [Leuconostoc]MBU7451561.1 heavy metal translocating P-type ATPase [Leuconostoc citreum]CUR64535.1 Heavy metal translocating (exporter) P-type ATPase [Leuconostoc gasicomitatum KG16-1]
MQKYILAHKKELTIINGSLLLLALVDHFFLTQGKIVPWALIIAGVAGALPIVVQAFQSLKVRIVSIDVLVTIAVLGAFFVKSYEEAAVVTFLFLAGHFLEQATLSKTRKAIKSLTEMAPEVSLKKDVTGKFVEVPIDKVDQGDTLLVKTGGKVPVDGKVITGSGYVNEASITGESKVTTKQVGSLVYAGTILENGTFQLQAERVGEETAFGKIIELVEEAQDSKSSAERFIDKFSKYYTPAVLLLAIIVGLITKDIELAVTVLVLGCPGALVIGIPVSNVAGIGNGAKHGILLKGSETVQAFSKVDTMVFDKTGTLTVGDPRVAKLITSSRIDKNEAIAMLVSTEAESNHPLAQAVVKTYPNAIRYPVSQTQVVKGGGIVATVKGAKVVLGNLQLMKSNQIELKAAEIARSEQLENEGNSLIFMAINNRLAVILGIKDQLRPNVKSELAKLGKLGVKNLILLSGDNQGTVNQVAKNLGLTEAKGNMLPEDKADFIKVLQKKGRNVTFVGDGVNDSPSLATANTGIAMGNGTDVAIDTSDIVLMNSDFDRLVPALKLAKATSHNMLQNIIIAVGVVIFLLSSLLFSSWINMGIGMFVHEASILVVVLNAIRLLNYRLK